MGDAGVIEATYAPIVEPVGSHQFKIDQAFVHANSKIAFVHFDLNKMTSGVLPLEPGVDNGPLCGKALMMRPPEEYKIVDAQESATAVDWAEEWMLEHGMVRKYEQEKRAKMRSLAKDMSILLKFFRPDDPLSSERMSNCLTASLTVFMSDDMLEESNFNKQDSTTGAMLGNLVETIVNGDPEEMEGIEDQFYPALRPAARAGKEFMQKVRAQHPDYKQNNEHAVAATKATTGAIFLLDVLGTDKGHVGMCEETFNYLRRADAALRTVLELWVVIFEDPLPREVRENLFFRRLVEVFEQISANDNDMLSLPKDIEHKAWNAVLFKVKKQGISLQEAMGQVVQQQEALVSEFLYLEGHLRRMYPDCDELEEYLDLMYSFKDGLGYLTLYMERYGDLKSAFLKVDN